MTSVVCSLLFAYGSLRPGGNAAWRLDGIAEHVGPAVLEGAILFQVTDYPAMVLSGNACDKVFGDVFRLNDPGHALTLLDAYEECSDDFRKPHEYVRTQHHVCAGTTTVLVWTYLYVWPTTGLKRIAGGDFLHAAGC